MKMKILLVLAFTIAFSFSTSIWACAAAGPATHVGNVLKVDVEKNTFTILDAQTMSLITFQANKKIMEMIEMKINADSTAFVDFKVDGTDLIATNVELK